MSDELAWITDVNAWPRTWRAYFEAGVGLEARNDLRHAASAYDRAFGLAPHEQEVAVARRRVLDALEVQEHGMVFRYVPVGAFTMGNEEGEADEAPAHLVELGGYWLADIPVTWARYCALMGWASPLDGATPGGWADSPRPQSGTPEWKARFTLYEENKLRYHYCRARRDVTGSAVETTDKALDMEEFLDDYNTRPMVSVGWGDAVALGEALSVGGVTYRLPTEAEWEKAARGGLQGCLYPWGDALPSGTLCDYARFDRFSILDPRSFAPNGYGLHAMVGTVWEWTADWYDALYYAESPRSDPQGPPKGRGKVLRGGSWADCEDVCTVSFRMERAPSRWRDGSWGEHVCPNVGFRLARVERAP